MDAPDVLGYIHALLILFTENKVTEFPGLSWS
jgi:hypothetical protein